MYIKKTFFILIIFIFLLGCSNPDEITEGNNGTDEENNFLPQTLQENLIAEYLFNGNIDDTSENVFNGYAFGVSLTSDRHGNNNRAIKLDGINDYVNIDHEIISSDDNSYAVSFWVMPDNFHTTEIILCMRSTINYGQKLLITLDSGIVGFGHNDTGSASGPKSSLDDVSQVSRNYWIHYVLQFTESGNQEIYRDGVLVATNANTTIVNVESATLTIGRWNNPISEPYYSGAIDDLRFFDRPLTKDEIATLYSEQSTNEELYSIIYNPNEADLGDVPTFQGATSSSTFIVKDNIYGLSKYYYTFAGWNTEPDGSGNFYNIGESYSINSNIELYAYWEEIEYDALIDISGGVFSQTETFNHTISDFQIGKYEVSYKLWDSVYTWAIANGYSFGNSGEMGFSASAWDGKINEPVTGINWRDSIVWCNAYSEINSYEPVYKNNLGEIIRDSRDSNGEECDNVEPDWIANGYRLPTEGEWQYAASGGDQSNGYNYSGSNNLDDISWYGGNSGIHTHELGTLQSNELGIYDMTGNVIEMCWDMYNSVLPVSATDYTGFEIDETQGAIKLNQRIYKGGSAVSNNYSNILYNSHRYYRSTYEEYEAAGFRVARTVSRTLPNNPKYGIPNNANVSLNTSTPTLSWLSCPGAIGYAIEVLTYEAQLGYTVLISDENITTNEYTINTPLTNDGYYWRVKEKDNNGLWSNWSRIYRFHIPLL